MKQHLRPSASWHGGFESKSKRSHLASENTYQLSWPIAHHKKGGAGTNCSLKVKIGNFFSLHFYFSVF